MSRLTTTGPVYESAIAGPSKVRYAVSVTEPRKPKFGRIYQKYDLRDGERIYRDVWTVRYKGKDYPTGEKDWNAAHRFLLKLASEFSQKRGRAKSGECLMSDLFEDLLDDYLNRERATTYDCKLKIDKYFNPLLGKIRAASFGSEHVKAYLKARRKMADEEGREVANATLNRELKLVKRALSLGFKHSPPKVDRVPHIEMLAESNVRKFFFTKEQYEALKKELPAHLVPILVFGYHVGCRRSELTGLKWNSVVLDSQDPHFFLWAGETKNDEGRTIPIYGEMVEAVAALKADRDENFPKCPWVFNFHGLRINRFYKSWDSACERAGLPGLHFHDLRRSAVRNMTRAGVSRVVAKQIIGHKTDSIYERYDIVDRQDIADAGRKMEEWAGKQ